MRTIAFLAFMLTLWVLADTSFAHAQDISNNNSGVRNAISDWLDDATAFRSGVQDTARLWQRNAPLLEVRTDIFVDEAQGFAGATESCADRIARVAPHSDAAAMLNAVAQDLEDRLNALGNARAQDAANVAQVLNGMDVIVAQVLTALGNGDSPQAEFDGQTPVTIRAAYVTDPSRSPAAGSARMASAH